MANTQRKPRSAKAQQDASLRVHLLQMQETITALCRSLADDTMSDAERTATGTLITAKKKAYVDAIHKRKINDHKGTRKLWWTKVTVEGKKEPQQITGTTEEILYEKLYRFYTEEQDSLVLTDLYRQIMPNLSGRRGKVSDKTKQEYARFWNKYFEADPISEKKINEITTLEWQKFFVGIIEADNLSEKEFGQVIIILNHIVKHCIAKGVLLYDPVKPALASRTYSFRKEEVTHSIKAEGLTEEQLEKVTEWCEAQLDRTDIMPIYILAILFNLIYGLRIGELKGIKWTDIDWDAKTLTVRRQHCSSVKMQEDLTFQPLGEIDLDHVKAYEKPRKLPLSDEAIDILQKVQELDLPGEYIFRLRHNTYSAKIKDAARYAGVSDLTHIHPHSLRVTAGTSVFSKSNNIKVAQAFLGHTNPAMTNRYIKGLDEFNILKAIL